MQQPLNNCSDSWLRLFSVTSWVFLSTSLGLLLLSPIAVSGQELSLDAEESTSTDTRADDPIGLSAVRDDYWLTADDNPAYYGLLNRIQGESPEEVEQAAREFVRKRQQETKLPTFIDMIRNPGEFRGRPVQLEGHVLQTLEYAAEENSYGIERLYESTLFTADSQSHPTTVVFLEKPENLPISGELIDGVSVTGYFLKTYWYPSGDNSTRKAPLILAKTVKVQPPIPVAAPQTSPLVYWALGAGFLVLMIMIVVIQRSDRKRILDNQKKRLNEAEPQFDAPANPDN